jgi:hypothetical protein
MNTKKPLLYVFLGMIAGAVIGFFIFFNADKSKGWNPYGWWFVATFALTVIGGMGGLLIYSALSRKTTSELEMNADISAIIEKGKKLKQTIGAMVTRLDYPRGDRSFLILAYHSICAEHHGSIHLLVEYQLYGSSFALVRSLYECLYRSHWVHGCATEDQIAQIIKGKDIFPRMNVMVEEIDKRYATEDFWQIVKNNSWSAMNDYAHSGMRQISRRFVQDTVDPNYEIDEIKEVLNGTNMALLLMAYFFFNVYKKDIEASTVREMILKYNKS